MAILQAKTKKPRRRSVAQVITTAKFRKPSRPKTCDIARYHVWNFDETMNQPMSGAKCQCGTLMWTVRPQLRWAYKVP